MVKAICQNVASGMTATRAKVAARIIPATVMARAALGTANLTALTMSRCRISRQMLPTEKTF